MDQIEKLTKYGVVRTCKVVENLIVTIVITDGFSQKSDNTLSFMKECLELFPEFPIMETCVTEDNLAIVVLKRKPLNEKEIPILEINSLEDLEHLLAWNVSQNHTKKYGCIKGRISCTYSFMHQDKKDVLEWLVENYRKN